MVERSRGGFSGDGPAGRDGGHGCGKVSAACEWLSFCRQFGGSRGCNRRSISELAAAFARSARLRDRSLRFGEKSAQNPWPLIRLISPLQNDFRVLLVVPLWPT